MATNFKPHIGKNVIETLTLGMYDDSRFVYREYVQNAADQIDVAFELGILSKKSDGRINIVINKDLKTIIVEDNATGIPSADVLRFLGDVANSSKDRAQRKGFRGIGRLGGLGYCQKLIFETSAKGESVKSTMSLDAKMLRSIILDTNETMDAASVISVITTVDRKAEDPGSHYFKIILEEVTNEKLLDEAAVVEYLSMVAPVPFKPDFKFSDEIKEFFKKNNYVLDEYHVNLNSNQLYKAYKNTIQEEDKVTDLVGVDFFQVRDPEFELLALGWFGFRDYANVVLPPTNKERGIRLRKNNIALGDEGTLSRFFKAERTNLRFIGEVHAVNASFIPNARRDYFNDNKTCQNFEFQLHKIFETQNLENRLAQTASKLHNRLKEIEQYKIAKKNYDEREFDNAAEQKQHIDSLKQAEEKAQRALKAISKIHQSTFTDKTVSKLYDSIVANKDLSVPNTGHIVVNKYDPPSFAKLKKPEADVAREIILILEENLSIEEAKRIKRLIIDRFN